MTLRLLHVAALLGLGLAACGNGSREIDVRLVSTTSTVDSGLLDAVLPTFEADTGFRIQVIARGTGAALALGRAGEADVLLVHARELEDAFVAEGHGALRHDVMANDFVLVGPPGDPAGARQAKHVAEALTKIHRVEGSGFASRGDGSGTHLREQRLWRDAGLDPTSDPDYLELGVGMAGLLQAASEKQAYTLVDRGTWLQCQERVDLEVVFEGGVALLNPYGVILVNPRRHALRNETAARALVAWLTSSAGRRAIESYRKHGEPLFWTTERER